MRSGPVRSTNYNHSKDASINLAAHGNHFDVRAPGPRKGSKVLNNFGGAESEHLEMEFPHGGWRY